MSITMNINENGFMFHHKFLWKKTRHSKRWPQILSVGGRDVSLYFLLQRRCLEITLMGYFPRFWKAWWHGDFLIGGLEHVFFPCIGKNIPNWFRFFRGGRYTTNQWFSESHDVCWWMNDMNIMNAHFHNWVWRKRWDVALTLSWAYMGNILW